MAGGSTVLIVDDNDAVRSVLAAYMSRVAGWPTVLAAQSANAALTIAQENDVDAIVLDNFMPGRDGIDVLPELRRLCPDARIVMHTTDDSGDLRRQAEAQGADAVVLKGRPLDELAEILAAA